MISERQNGGPAADVREEHHALRELLDEMATALSKPRCGQERWQGLLRLLHRHVVAHFRNEEEGGSFRELTGAAPWLAARANSLLREHRLLLAHLDKLLSTGLDNQSRATARSEFYAFRHAFLDHEARENRLLQDALCDDLGAAD